MDPEARLTQALAGRYAIDRTIGAGGMATVYLAEDLKHRRKVAVKVMDPEIGAAIGVERFLREIETAANLTHPHILPLHDSGEADGFLFYVMPFVKGESLQAALERETQLPVDEAIRYAGEIADALAYSHEEGVVHRDIKPANILLEAGHAVLMDFGVAQAAASADDSRLTKTGVSLGTPVYMSPEQIAGDRNLDGRCDQYALACVLFEMLVGEPPFTGATSTQVMARVLSDPPPKVSSSRPSVGARIDEAIARALEKVPADRFPTIREFGSALSAAAETPRTLPSMPVLDVPRPAPKARKTLRWLASSISLAVLVLAGGLLFLGSTNDFGFQRRDWILVADFQNNTGEQVFDYSLANALSVGLQQSNHVNVFPKTRVAQTLQRMLQEDTGALDAELGREVAVRENIQLLVVPTIDRIDDTYVLAISMVDASSGEALLSRSEHAQGGNEVLPALDRLARRLRRDLGESRFSISRQSVPLGTATTPSLEALEAWSEGNFHWGQRRFDEAVTLYQRAIELDSAFAMAHADLGGAYYFDGNRPEADRHVELALSFSDRITERERLWIQAEVESWRENYDDAIDAYNIYLTRYPDDLDGWFRLGYALMRQGQSADAVGAFSRVAEMDPENAGAAINLATCYNFLNQREEALEHYLKAFELAPEWLTSGNLNHEFGFNYVELGQIPEAEAVFSRMLEGNDDQKALGYRSLGLMKTYSGRTGEAAEDFRRAAVLHRALEYELSEMRDRLYLAGALWQMGLSEAAQEELASVRDLLEPPSTTPPWLAYAGKAHARYGFAEEAQEILDNAVERADEAVEADQAAVALLRGETALAAGNLQEGVEHLEVAYALRENAYNLESLAYGLYRAGNLTGALERYQALLAQPELGWEVQEFWIASHIRIGEIYEERGDATKALEWYRAFLDLRRDGDPDLPSTLDIMQRVEGLTSGGQDPP